VPPIPPAGFSLAGIGEVGELPPLPSPRAMLASQRTASRDVASLTRGLHPVDAAVEHAMSVKRFSGAALDAGGNTVYRIKYLQEGAERGIQADFAAALDWLVVGRHIAIERFETVIVEGGNGMSATVLHYRNLRTGEQRSSSSLPR
jgi:hypothetical protein